MPKSRLSSLNSVDELSFFQQAQKSGGFLMETCQRWVWVTPQDSRCSPSQLLFSLDPEVQFFSGYEAYFFLLRFASGLESEVQGETDIFGQIKAAWQSAQKKDPFSLQALDPWIQRLFEDTKYIRSQYLQNTGGSSYGTLVRKILKDSVSQEALKAPVLLVGAGQLAQSIAPLLLDLLMDRSLLLWNRSLDGSLKLYSSLLQFSSQPRKPTLEIIQDEDQHERAWKTARQIIVCIPSDPILDPKRRAWLEAAGGLDQTTVIHLGGRRSHLGAWSPWSRFYCLDEVFQYEKAFGNIRSVQMKKAIRACDERAKLRSLGASLCISHGWEDLATFA
ncbi:MAG: hypothetical protein ACO3A2_00025 [Bdellovibrionia bacterium]